MRLLLVAVLLAGCTTLDDTACRNANWFELGERDALIYGLRPQVDVYAHQCSKVGVQISERDYLAGWFQGDRERAWRMGGECCAPN